MFSPIIDQLIHALRCLPGVGNKSAQRMAFYLLEHDREGAQTLAKHLMEAVQKIKHCNRCRNLSETLICKLCENPKRNSEQLCIIESPADVLAMEQTSIFQGLYFVLMGHLSPMDGIGPEEIGIEQLQIRLHEGEVKEIILATNPTVEGEATAHYIAEMAKPMNLKVSRIAYGVPLGGELEYVDSGTLTRAFVGRRDFN